MIVSQTNFLRVLTMKNILNADLEGNFTRLFKVGEKDYLCIYCIEILNYH